MKVAPQSKKTYVISHLLMTKKLSIELCTKVAKSPYFMKLLIALFNFSIAALSPDSIASTMQCSI